MTVRGTYQFVGVVVLIVTIVAAMSGLWLTQPGVSLADQRVTETPANTPVGVPTETSVPERPTPTSIPTRNTPVPTTPPVPVATGAPLPSPTPPSVQNTPIPTQPPSAPQPMPDPPEDDLEPTPPPAHHGDTTITVIPHFCPEPSFNPNPSTVTPALLDANCGANLTVDSFKMNQGAISNIPWPYRWSYGDAVFWNVKPNLAAHVKQSTIPGIKLAFVYCTSNQERAGWFEEIAPYENYAFSDSITLLPQFNEKILCEFYTRTLTEPGVITIHVLECPVGYDLKGIGANPMQDCTTPIDGLFIKINHHPHNAVNNDYFWGDSGDDGPGTIVFDYVPTYNYQVHAGEQGPLFDETWAFSCNGGPYEYNEDYVPPQWIPIIQLSPGGNLGCTFYMVPAAD